jgi:dolichol kinase
VELKSELKRKVFHHLSLLYLGIYCVAPRWFSIFLFALVLAILGGVEFIRILRPELNAQFLEKFGGIHRDSEILHPSGIFWTLLGSWLTIVIFTSKRIVLPALGLLVFGDTVAAIAGHKWGKHPWRFNPAKTWEGSAGFAVVSAVWAIFFVRWPVAIASALSGAWVEAYPLPYNDNLWIPVLGGAALSVFNLVMGR